MNIPSIVAVLIGFSLVYGVLLLVGTWSKLSAQTALAEGWNEGQVDSVAGDLLRILKRRADTHQSPEFEVDIDRCLAGRGLLEPGAPAFVANSAVYAGLFGTMLGLIFAIQPLSNVQSVKTISDLTRFAGDTSEMLRGFSGAFTAALAGIAVTVTLNLLLKGWDKEQLKLINELERLAAEVMWPKLNPLSREDRLLAVIQSSVEHLDTAVASAAATFSLVNEGANQYQETLTSLNNQLVASSDTMLKVFGEMAKSSQNSVLALKASFEEVASKASESTDKALASVRELVQASSTQMLQNSKTFAELLADKVDRSLQENEATKEMMGKVQEVVLQMAIQIENLEKGIKKAEGTLEGYDNLTQELRKASNAVEMLSKAIQTDFNQAVAPVLEAIQDENKAIRHGFEEFEGTLRAHADFLTQLAVIVQELPDTLSAAHYHKLEVEILKPLEDKIDRQDQDFRIVQQNLENYKSEVQASGQQVDGRVLGIEQALKDLQQSSKELQKSQNNNSDQILGSITSIVRDIREDVRSLGVLGFRWRR